MDINRQQYRPLNWKKTVRNLEVAAGSALQPGKCVPLAFVPLLRQDKLNGRVNINLEMMETNELLANRVKVRASAYIVPNLAKERFEGSRDQMDRSYWNQPQVDGGAVVPWFDFHAMGAPGADEIYHSAGLIAREGAMVETSYVESYNAIYNYRARNCSRNIELRAFDDTSFARAFWDKGRFQHLVPSVDTDIMEGEVALNVVDSRMPVKGIGKLTQTFPHSNGTIYETGETGSTSFGSSAQIQPSNANTEFFVEQDPDNPGFPAIFAEMAENGITISLSNLGMARKMQALAKMRERYTGLSDDEASAWIIDHMMAGLKIPDQAYKRPMLVSTRTTVFDQGKRYATNSDALDESAVSGNAALSLDLLVPELDVGGTLVIMVECFPEQLFERQQDPMFHIKDHMDEAVANGEIPTYALPEPTRDWTDPQPIDYVYNREIDALHTTPDDTFAYGPKNWKWFVRGPRLGGGFHQQTASSAMRQRFWASEPDDPVLDEDFYLVSEDLAVDIFKDTARPPFEVFASGNVSIRGNTQTFGRLLEATDNWEKIAEKVDNSRIEEEEA